MSVVDTAKPKTALIYNPRFRGFVYQALLCLVVGFLAWAAVTNAAENLARAKIASGFGFWENTAGFDISQTLIHYTVTSTYGRAFWVGLLNTLLIAALGIVFATFLGFAIGIARLSKNWLVAKVATGYVELIRNLPLLLQLLFWYNAVLAALPEMRESLALPGSIFLNNRGLFIPQPLFGPEAPATLVALVGGIVCAIVYRFWARQRQLQTGEQMPVFWVVLGFLVIPPLVAFALAGFPVECAYPE
jgi:general L-amino acid transport system permease protein